MDIPATAETQLVADVAALRERFPNTQELYREVCTVMFFRYGITPTANKLYQYVKKGSMSAPTEALAKFWDTLREKSRVRIEHPELPEELRTGVGELAAALWDLAQQRARAALQSLEVETRASVLEAETARKQAETRSESLREQGERTRAGLAEAREQLGVLQQQLAAAGALRGALEARLAQAQDDITALRHANERARQDFAAEIGKLRQESQLAEERFRTAEKRALLEIDRERTASAKLQKEVETAHGEAARSGERHRLELAALQQQLGDARQKLGQIEGQLEGLRTQSAQLALDLREAQRRTSEEAVRAATLETERNGWQLRAETAEKAFRELKEQTTKRRLPRKSKENEQ
jgi:chromosome segregation ATPase